MSIKQMNNIHPQLENYLQKVVEEITDGNPQVCEDAKSIFRPHLSSIFNNYIVAGLSERDAAKKAIMAFIDASVLNQSSEKILNHKNWAAQKIIKHLCLLIWSLILFINLDKQLFDAFILMTSVVFIPIYIMFFIKYLPSLSITSKGLCLKTAWGRKIDIPLDQIETVSCENKPLCGKCSVEIILRNGKKYITNKAWGLKASLKYLVAKRPEVVTQKVSDYITQIRNYRLGEYRWLSVLFSILCFAFSTMIIYGNLQYYHYGIIPLYTILTISAFFFLFVSIINALDHTKILILTILIILYASLGNIVTYLISSYDLDLIYKTGLYVIILLLSAFAIYHPRITKKYVIKLTLSLIIGFLSWHGIFNYTIDTNSTDYEFIRRDEFANAKVWTFTPHSKGNSIACNFMITNSPITYHTAIISNNENNSSVEIIDLPLEMTYLNTIPVSNPGEYLIFSSSHNPDKDPLPLIEKSKIPDNFHYARINTDTVTYKDITFKMLPEYSWGLDSSSKTSADGKYLYASKWSVKSDSSYSFKYFIYDLESEKEIFPKTKDLKYHLSHSIPIDNSRFVCLATDESDKLIYAKCRITDSFFVIEERIPVLENRNICFLKYPYSLECGKSLIPIVKNLETNTDYSMNDKIYGSGYQEIYFDIYVQNNGFLAAYSCKNKDTGQLYINIFDSLKNEYKKIELNNFHDVSLLSFSPDGKRLAFLQSLENKSYYMYSAVLSVINLETGEISLIYRYGIFDILLNGVMGTINFRPFAWSPDSSYLAFSYSTVALEKKKSFGIGIWKVPK